jgi:hypothetical protein
MRHFLRKAIAIGRISWVSFSLLALLITGFVPADRLSSRHQRAAGTTDDQAIQIEIPTTEAALEQVEGPVDKANASENMTPSGKPNCEPQACFVNAAVSKSENSECRLGVDDRDLAYRVTCPAPSRCHSPLMASCAQVEPRLGHQFTLVGAHPSGTS